VRQDAVDSAVFAQFSRLELTAEERLYIRQELERMRGDANGQRQELVTALKLRLSQIDERLGRLTDAYIDRVIEKDLFETRKEALLSERLDVHRQIADWQAGKRDTTAEVAKFIERADSACLAYKTGNVDEKRDLLDSLTSNRLVDGKVPTIMLSLPFSVIAERSNSHDGRPRRNIHLTWRPILSRLAHILGLDTRTSRTMWAQS
jgi:site-specific DNA recombinase